MNLIHKRIKVTVEQAETGVAIIMDGQAKVLRWQDAMAFANLIRKHALEARGRIDVLPKVAGGN